MVTSSHLPPGSTEAQEAGCRCPVMDNGRGRGLWTDENGTTQYVMRQDCPLHGWPLAEGATG